mgnify:CR=1 FL=1
MPKVAFVNPDTSFDVQHGTPESGDSDTCEGQGSRSLALESLAANPNAELRVATVFVGGFPIAIQGDYNTEHVHGNQDLLRQAVLWFLLAVRGAVEQGTIYLIVLLFKQAMKRYLWGLL